MVKKFLKSFKKNLRYEALKLEDLMLSVLIPTFNYDCHGLVKKLHEQTNRLNIEFEILVSEDGGNQMIANNRQINNLTNSTYIENKKNLGRAGNINRLLEASSFDLKLILDCDTEPKNDNFIKTYLQFAQDKTTLACFGGISYENHDNQNHNLRYNYGIKREARTAEQREKDTYKYLLTSNILLKNCSVKFDDRIKTYGYDDLVFSKQLKKEKITAYHIDNPVYHLNLEDNLSYLKKTETALKTLSFLEKNQILSTRITKISGLYHIVKSLYLSGLLNLVNRILNQVLKKQLINKGGPLYLFDLYKLLYFNKHY